MKKYSRKNRQAAMREVAASFTGARLENLLEKLTPRAQTDVMRTIARLRKPPVPPPTAGMDDVPIVPQRASGEDVNHDDLKI